MAYPKSKIPACETCREKHLKCDRATPACSNCRRLGQPTACSVGDLRFKQSRYSIKTLHQNVGGIPKKKKAEGQTARNEKTSPPTALPPPLEASEGYESQRAPTSATEKSLLDGKIRSPTFSPQQLVTDETERYVFEFYINYAAPCIDIVSIQQHFSRFIPRLAMRSPVLYYTCLTYASMLLHLNDGLDKSIHDQYQTEAISYLIPLLSQHCVLGTDQTLLLTSAVILRMTEQYSDLDRDAQHHLRGACSIFMTTQERWSPAMTDVRGVSFWIYIRESIRASFLREVGCQFDLSTVDPDCHSETEDDEIWTNRITYLVARLCDACWGDAEPEEREKIKELIATSLDKWHANLPDTFQPWYFSTSPSDAFPVVKYVSSWHEIAWQNYYTARVMLAVYASPSNKGETRPRTAHDLETKIRSPARMACAICFNSPHTGGPLNGCHLITWCGQFFDSVEEQKILGSFLVDFSKRTKWPTKASYKRLQGIWNGTRKSWKDI